MRLVRPDRPTTMGGCFVLFPEGCVGRECRLFSLSLSAGRSVSAGLAPPAGRSQPGGPAGAVRSAPRRSRRPLQNESWFSEQSHSADLHHRSSKRHRVFAGKASGLSRAPTGRLCQDTCCANAATPGLDEGQPCCSLELPEKGRWRERCLSLLPGIQ